jgi:orotate phosphoribosyltransferase
LDVNLIKLLIDSEALKFGHFILKSGASSPFFIDIGQIKEGRHLTLLGEFLARAVRERFPEARLVFGPAYKGIVLASALIQASWSLFGKNLSMLYDRKEAKNHGEKGSFIGKSPEPGENLIIVDDVLTSGQTKLDAIKALEKTFRVFVLGTLVVVDRTPKGMKVEIPFHSLTSLPEIARFLTENGDSRGKTIQEFWENGK